MDSGSLWFNPKARIHYLPQEPQFVPGHTVLESVLDGNLPVMKLLQQYEDAVQKGDDRAVVSLSAEMDREQAWELERKPKSSWANWGFLTLRNPSMTCPAASANVWAWPGP